MSMEAAVPFATILSNWYSGATLLSILLDRHTQLTCNGESMPFFPEDCSQYKCTCGNYLENCEFYRFAAEHMRAAAEKGWNAAKFSHIPRFSKSPYVNSVLTSPRLAYKWRDRFIDQMPAYRAIKDLHVRAQMVFFRQALLFSGGSVYVDGTKSIRRAQLLANSHGCQMKIIHLVRDGRGFCFSWVKNQHIPISRITEGAKAWLDYIKLVDAFARRYPDIPILLVRYEDLCRSPGDCLDKVFSFLGVQHEDVILKNNHKAHILGNRMRHSFHGCISEDTSWAAKLDPECKSLITFRMKKQLHRFGYLN